VKGHGPLKSLYLGDRAPMTLATVWEIATSPKKEVESFRPFRAVLFGHPPKSGLAPASIG